MTFPTTAAAVDDTTVTLVFDNGEATFRGGDGLR